MSRLTKRSIELYGHLTAKQKAAVALGIYDPEELDVIHSTVERKTYKMIDADFADWQQWGFKISTMLGLEYWQSKANEYRFKHAIRGAYLVADEERENEEMAERERVLIADLTAAIPVQQSKQATVLAALYTLSTENGFLFADALKLAGIAAADTERLEGAPVDDHLLAHLLDGLRNAAPKALI